MIGEGLTRRARIALVGGVVAGLLAISLLVRVESEVRVLLTVQRLSLYPANAAAFVNRLPAVRLTVPAFARVELGEGVLELAETTRVLGDPGLPAVLTGSTATAGVTLEKLTITELAAPQGSRLIFEVDPARPERLVVRADRGEVVAVAEVLPGSHRIRCPGCGIVQGEAVASGGDTPLIFVPPARGELRIIGGGDGLTLEAEVPADQMWIERTQNVLGGLVLHATGDDGRLVFPTHGDRTVPVAAGQEVRVTGKERLVAAWVRLGKGIEVCFRGTAVELRSGAPGALADQRSRALLWLWFEKKVILICAIALILSLGRSFIVAAPEV